MCSFSQISHTTIHENETTLHVYRNDFDLYRNDRTPSYHIARPVFILDR